MSLIIDEIKNICEIELGLPFMYESVSMTNVKLDKQKDFPVAILLTVTDWTVDNTIGNFQEVASIKLFFLNRTNRKPTIDYDATTTQTLIDQCKDYALNFISEINLSKSITFTSSNIQIQSIVDYDDANVCGVMVNATIKELGGKCLPIVP